MTLVGVLMGGGLLAYSFWLLHTYDTPTRRDRRWARRHRI